ncbi:MAG: hypothetical protein AB8B73_07045 [Ekhidna sp.]
MKNILYISFLLFSVCSFSQRYVDTNDPDNEEVKSLLSKGNDLNAFGAMDLKVGNFMGERALVAGAYGGFIINRRYLFGVAGYGLVTNVEFEGTVPNHPAPKNLNLHGGYGGVLIGPTIAHKELIHLSMPIILGVGSFEVVDKNYFASNVADSEFTIENSIFFVVEPGIQLEFNITKYFRIAAGVTYRYISGTELANVTDKKVTNTSGVLSFRFGRF